MTSDYLIAGNHNIPVAVIPTQQFMGKLPLGFHRGEDGKMHHDRNRVNLFLEKQDRKLFANAYGKVAKVVTDEAFTVMKQRLMTLPIFLNLKLKEQYTEHYVVAKRTVITYLDVVAYINPTHPVIKAQLQQQFDECERLVGEGKKFSFEIRIGEILKSWYASTRPSRMFASYYCYGGTICVTNFGQRCNMCYHPLAWCIPITWILGPPYLIYRAVKCNDVIAELSAVVTLMKEGPQIIFQQAVPGPQQMMQMPPPYANVPGGVPQLMAPNAGVEMLPPAQPQFTNIAPMARVQPPINTNSGHLQKVTNEDDEPLLTA